MSSNWSQTNLPSAEDAAAAKTTLSELTRGGQLANTDLIEWVNARVTLDWAEHARVEAAEGDGWAR